MDFPVYHKYYTLGSYYYYNQWNMEELKAVIKDESLLNIII